VIELNLISQSSLPSFSSSPKQKFVLMFTASDDVLDETSFDSGDACGFIVKIFSIFNGSKIPKEGKKHGRVSGFDSGMKAMFRTWSSLRTILCSHGANLTLIKDSKVVVHNFTGFPDGTTKIL
jgi:hypothetical protein